MSKILMVYERDMPVVRIIQKTLSAVSAGRDIELRAKFLTDLKPEDVDRAELLLLMRPNDALSWRLARKARRAGCFVVSFFDDDLLHLPPTIPTVPWRRAAIRKALKWSDAVCSSSRCICAEYKGLCAGNRSVYIDSVVEEDEIAALEERLRAGRAAPDGPVRIVYAAGVEHVSFYNDYIKPVIPYLIERYGERVSLTFVCVRPDLSEFEGRIPISYVKGMPLSEYRRFMLDSAFDIGLAPLDDSRFSRCKYFNKYIEYTLNGTVGIYSRVEPYSRVITDGVNGFLADNTPEAWKQKLSEAIENPRLRESCRAGALQHVKDNFSPARVGENLAAELPELISCRRERRKCAGFFGGRVLYGAFCLMDWAYLALFYLRKTGLKGFINKWKTHFRERNAYKKRK